MTAASRGGWLLLWAGVSLLAATSCSPSPPHAAGLTSAQIGAEYRAETTTLSLPTGRHFPARTYDSRGIYQAGVGKNDADAFWWCSWGAQFLSSTGAARQQALQELHKVKQTYMYTTSFDENTRRLTDKQLAAASLDDPGPLRQDHQVNCG